MPLSPETLVRHELVGLPVRVIGADHPDLVDIEGRVVDETTNTLRIAGPARTRTVPKAGATFAFELPAGETVSVEGRRLVARPARRTERKGGTRWHSA